MLKRLCAPFFIAAGANHFVNPKFYLAIMPDYVPAHQELVGASGVAEIVGGAALLHPATRRFGAWWLVATLIAVFPANLHMALHPERYRKISPAGLYARLPVQLLFVAWVRAAARA